MPLDWVPQGHKISARKNKKKKEGGEQIAFVMSQKRKQEHLSPNQGI